MLRIQAMDHIVLLVSDVERTVAWYRDELGLGAERLEEWRRGEVLFPSVRINDGTIIDVLQGERSGKNIDHLCLTFEPVDLAAVRDSRRFDVVEGPVTRWGARGNATSLYVRDPDGNVVELRHYGAGNLT